MDSLFRKQKGYIFVSKMTLEKFGKRYRNTLNFLEKMMEDPLEIKVYISEIVNAKDAVDAEDGVFTLVNYAEVLTEKAKTLLAGGKYKNDNLVKMNNEQVRERLNSLLEVTAQMIAESDNLQTIRLKTIELEDSLEQQIGELEKEVASTEKELITLTKTAKANMDKGIVTINSIAAKTTTTTLVVLVVVVILAVSIGLFSARKITKPLYSIITVAENIKDGNLMCGQIVHQSSDEFGALTNSINKMKQSLCELVGNIKDSTDYLSKTSDQSTDLMHKMHENLNNTNMEMAAAASAAEELSSSTTNIIDSVTVGITEVQQAKEKVIDGNFGLQNSIAQVSSVANNLSGVAGSLNELKTASQEISNIVSIIVDIAEQTNLLALNAAIEAARAGEAGRGFAVVADEVRKLAERTQTATGEVENIVSQLMKDTSSARDSMGTSVEKVNEGIDLIRNLEKFYRKVSDNMQNINSEQSIISSSMSSSAENIEEVNHSLQGISASIQEASQAIGQIAGAATGLQSNAANLSEKSETFKI